MSEENENENPPDKERLPRVREESLCPCKSRLAYKNCCMPYHYGQAKCETAEDLMRSRYSAYFFRRVHYLVDSTHPDTRSPTLALQIERDIEQAQWTFLRIIETVKGTKDDKVGKVEFVADYYLDGELYEMRERSRFKRYKGVWKYLDDRG